MPNIELFTAGIRGKRHQQQEKLFTPKCQNRFIFLDNNIESNQADSRAMTVCEYRQAYAKIEASPIPETKWSSSHYIEMLSLRLGTESHAKKGRNHFHFLLAKCHKPIALDILDIRHVSVSIGKQFAAANGAPLSLCAPLDLS